MSKFSCFFDIAIGGKSAGRIVMEVSWLIFNLFDNFIIIYRFVVMSSPRQPVRNLYALIAGITLIFNVFCCKLGITSHTHIPLIKLRIYIRGVAVS